MEGVHRLYLCNCVSVASYIEAKNGVKTVPNRYKEQMDKTQHVFQEQLFPYRIEDGRHFVMWYATKEQKRSDEEITSDIETELKAMTGTEDAFQFGWYVNPKMTVPEFFHVQVFVKVSCLD